MLAIESWVKVWPNQRMRGKECKVPTLILLKPARAHILIAKLLQAFTWGGLGMSTPLA